jgi:hypothetical protein
VYLILETKQDLEINPIQRYGTWLHYIVGYLPPEAEDYVDYRRFDATVISEDVANAWKYAGLARDFINIRPETLQSNQIFAESEEKPDEKIKYYLTDKDFKNTIEFMKTVLKKILYTHYNKELKKLDIESSILEMSTWEQQKNEAFAYIADNNAATPTLSILARERGITVEELSNKVANKVNQYYESIAILLAKQQKIEQLLKNAESVKDLNRIMHNHFGYSMPVAQKEEEGVTDEPRLDL